MEYTKRRYRCTGCRQTYTKHTDFDQERPKCSNKSCEKYGEEMKKVADTGAISNIRNV